MNLLVPHDATTAEIEESITHLRERQRGCAALMVERYGEQIDRLLDELNRRRCAS